MNRKIIVTEDNSNSLLIPSLDETYHSTHGAITESEHIFIKAGLNHVKNTESITIFEMGFGSGLNLLTTLREIVDKNIKINYTTIEKYPLTPEEHKLLNHEKLIERADVRSLFKQAIDADWNTLISLNTHIQFKKITGDLKHIDLLPNSVDLIYYDAFGPRVQPNLWTIEIMKKMYDLLRNNGVLVTYCAQGQLKRTLKEVGFSIESLIGPPGKREMTRALKKN